MHLELGMTDYFGPRENVACLAHLGTHAMVICDIANEPMDSLTIKFVPIAALMVPDTSRFVKERGCER